MSPKTVPHTTRTFLSVCAWCVSVVRVRGVCLCVVRVCGGRGGGCVVCVCAVCVCVMCVCAVCVFVYVCGGGGVGSVWCVCGVCVYVCVGGGGCVCVYMLGVCVKLRPRTPELTGLQIYKKRHFQFNKNKQNKCHIE